jgi:hypothetical protein
LTKAATSTRSFVEQIDIVNSVIAPSHGTRFSILLRSSALGGSAARKLHCFK